MDVYDDATKVTGLMVQGTPIFKSHQCIENTEGKGAGDIHSLQEPSALLSRSSWNKGIDEVRPMKTRVQRGATSVLSRPQISTLHPEAAARSASYAPGLNSGRRSPNIESLQVQFDGQFRIEYCLVTWRSYRIDAVQKTHSVHREASPTG